MIKNPMTPTMILRSITELIVISSKKRMTIMMRAPTQQNLKILLYLLYFFKYSEETTAPMTPSKMSRTTESEISMSDIPKGLIRRLALEAKVWKLPKMSQ